MTNINLDLSMFPSFASVLFRKVENNVWIKELGYGTGTVIAVKNGRLICNGPSCSSEAVTQWAGAWFDPYDYVSRVSRRLRSLVEVLLSTYSGLRIIISSYYPDRLIIAIATFLSRRTSYHTNVIKWVKSIFSGIKDYKATHIAKKIPEVGSNYQLSELLEVVEDLERVVVYSNLRGWELRRELLNIKNVGPKVADAFLLFTGEGAVFTPSDVHYSRFARRLGLVGDEDILIPNKSLCLTYGASCMECPVRTKCLTGKSVAELGELSGYVQTIAYIHDKVYCSLRRCGECAFKRICVM